MSGRKLSGDEVPKKFAEWLLLMGCPAEKVPSVEKVSQMCRGQYYMVWRSMMEHVYPKEIIKQKRLQVFHDDVMNCQKNVYNKKDSPTVPEEILLWRQQTELRAKVAEAEQKVAAAQQNLHELLDKISSKVAKRNISRKQVEDIQRRAFMLTQVAEELRTNRDNLQEVQALVQSSCTLHNEDEGVKIKLDKYLSTFDRTSPQRRMNASMLQVASTPDNNNEDPLNNLLKCSNSAIWCELIERRTALASKLAEYNAQPAVRQTNTGVTPQSVLSSTIALQCTLALESMKNKAHLNNTRKKFADAVTELKLYQPEARELFVLQSEVAEASARIESLKQSCEEIVSQSGMFEVTGERFEVKKKIPSGSLNNKKEELHQLASLLVTMERKILNVRDQLLAVFNAFYKDTPSTEIEKYKGVQIDLPIESISELRRFYEERRENSTKKMELSLNLDVSDISFNDNTKDSTNINFSDGLKMYMKSFNLEKNRKLVLESGDQIWIFETLSSSLERFHIKLQNNNIITSLMCPTQSVTHNLRDLLNELQRKADLENMIVAVKGENRIAIDFDIKTMKEQEEKQIDSIKKRLSENIQKLQTTEKTLNLGQENLKFWAENTLKNYISSERKVNGQTYKEYELLYTESVKFK